MFYAALEYGWFVLAEILRSLRINGFGGGGEREGEGERARAWTAEILRNFLKDFTWKMKGNMYLREDECEKMYIKCVVFY